MEGIGLIGSVRSKAPAGCRADRVAGIAGPAVNRGGGDFAAILLAMAGHDLRQPLQVITSAHDVLAHLLDTEEQREELTQAANAAAQLSVMLGQLVEGLKLCDLPRDGLRIAVPLRPFLGQLAVEFADEARRKGIVLLVSAPHHVVFSHPFLLIAMLRNLIRNAIDYTPEGGVVLVTAHRHGSELRIEVRDTGNGIAAAARPRIFDAFHRVDHNRSDGLGLGLFIVKRLADLLGHRVEVRSAEGRGSSFTIIAAAAPYDVAVSKGSLCRQRTARNDGRPAIAAAAVLP